MSTPTIFPSLKLNRMLPVLTVSRNSIVFFNSSSFNFNSISLLKFPLKIRVRLFKRQTFRQKYADSYAALWSLGLSFHNRSKCFRRWIHRVATRLTSHIAHNELGGLRRLRPDCSLGSSQACQRIHLLIYLGREFGFSC